MSPPARDARGAFTQTLKGVELTDHAASAWRDSPVTSLVIRWLHPELGRVLDRMLSAAIDDQIAKEGSS